MGFFGITRRLFDERPATDLGCTEALPAAQALARFTAQALYA